jgi:hypothetical protein
MVSFASRHPGPPGSGDQRWKPAIDDGGGEPGAVAGAAGAAAWANAQPGTTVAATAATAKRRS